jgi:hypothetical protein
MEMSAEKPSDEIPDVVERVWREICEMTDRTSPAEYPDMALITLDELRAAGRVFVEWERNRVADYIEGAGGKIPGASVFASLVSRNNQPCMSGDPRDRLNSLDRRAFDDAMSSLAADIRSRKP